MESEKKVELATEKQVNCLKRFVKESQELSKGILKGVEFSDLSKSEATELIQRCYDEKNGAGDAGFVNGQFKVKFAQNYKAGEGKYRTAVLSDEELETVRSAHKEHCIEVMKDLEDDYPDDKEYRMLMFEKRADKIFTWVQSALDEKVRMARR